MEDKKLQKEVSKHSDFEVLPSGKVLNEFFYIFMGIDSLFSHRP